MERMVGRLRMMSLTRAAAASQTETLAPKTPKSHFAPPSASKHGSAALWLIGRAEVMVNSPIRGWSAIRKLRITHNRSVLIHALLITQYTQFPSGPSVEVRGDSLRRHQSKSLRTSPSNAGNRKNGISFTKSRKREEHPHNTSSKARRILPHPARY
jgi:hypothetical protein